jgi:hypothetical protein
MGNLSFPDIKSAKTSYGPPPGTRRINLILDKVFSGKKGANIFETERGTFQALGILVDGFEYPGDADAAHKKIYVREIKTKIDQAPTVKALGGDFHLIGKHNKRGSIVSWPLTKVIKSEELGGGSSGSGGGAKDTEITESLQCYYTSVKYNGGADWKKLTDSPKGINKKILTDYAKYCDTGKISLDRCLAAVKERKSLLSWVDTEPNVFIKTANGIYDSTFGKKFKKRPVYFHRDSAFMKAVYLRRKKCMEHDKLLAAKDDGSDMIAPASFSNDKWNPGDIWMSTLSKTVKDPFSVENYEGDKGLHSCDWPSLKHVVMASANLGETMGVSLKKVTGRTAHVTEFNKASREQNKKVEYLGFTFGQTGDFFSSADVYLYFTTSGIPNAGGEQKMQWRAFDSTKSWQGEIKGSAAAGGKIGGGATNYFVEKYYDEKSIGGGKKEDGWSELQPDWNKAFKLYKDYNKKQLTTKLKKDVPDTVMKQDEFNKQADAFINNQNRPAAAAFKFGKYMGLLLIDSILKGDSTKPNKLSKKGTEPNQTHNSWAMDTFRYAQSNIEISSFYIKVS